MQFESADSDEVSDRIGALVPGVDIRPAAPGDFGAAIRGFAFPASRMMSIELQNGEARVPESRAFVSATFVRRRGFEVCERRCRDFLVPFCAHLTAFRSNVCFQPATGGQVIATLFDDDLILSHAAESSLRIDALLDWLPVQLDLRRKCGRAFVQLLREFEDDFMIDCAPRVSLAFAAESESELIGSFLEVCYEQAGYPSKGSLYSERIDRAEEFLRHSLAEPVTLVAIAAAADTSVRTLMRGFRNRFGVSPMQHLRALRLDGAHRVLERAAPDELSVTRVALDHGLPHLGRFASDYGRRFGERPSDTLRRDQKRYSGAVSG
jgi:AraC-like DNA-binding protein